MLARLVIGLLYRNFTSSLFYVSESQHSFLRYIFENSVANVIIFFNNTIIIVLTYLYIVVVDYTNSSLFF